LHMQTSTLPTTIRGTGEWGKTLAGSSVPGPEIEFHAGLRSMLYSVRSRFETSVPFLLSNDYDRRPYPWKRVAVRVLIDIRYLQKAAMIACFLMARNPNGQGKVCKAFVWWFDSIPRLHPGCMSA
jgi:hypothetical protein